MKKILVTGADGFIGSHLVEKLIEKGFSVKAFVNYNFQNDWGWLEQIDKNIKREIEIISGDIRDFDCVKNSVEGCGYVFNLAALIGIPYSYRAPKSYIDTNLIGLLNVMNSVKEKNNIRIIHTSTSEVYGTASFVPMTEEHPLNAQSPYAASKIAADQLANSFFKSFGLPISILRPFNTYGPRQSLRAIIPTIITQLLNKKLDKIKLGNINVKRDFNFISDTVDGFVSTIKNEKIIGETINIGNNYEISIKDIYTIIRKQLKINKKIMIDKPRVRSSGTEVKRLFASNKKAKKLLNWSPKFKNKNGIENGIKIAIEWYKNPNNIKKFKSDIYNI
jgi:NAD dependent epimerase/dehydratase